MQHQLQADTGVELQGRPRNSHKRIQLLDMSEEIIDLFD